MQSVWSQIAVCLGQVVTENFLLVKGNLSSHSALGECLFWTRMHCMVFLVKVETRLFETESIEPIENDSLF